LEGHDFSRTAHSDRSTSALQVAEKGLYFARDPEMRPSAAKANADLIDLIGTAKAVPLQN